jgi:hypothetical protein
MEIWAVVQEFVQESRRFCASIAIKSCNAAMAFDSKLMALLMYSLLELLFELA